MLLAIENILTNEELSNARELFAKAQFVDGRVTLAKTRFALMPGHDDGERSRPH